MNVGATPDPTRFKAALADDKITFEEAQELKKVYGSKAEMVAALTAGDDPIAKDKASAQKLADMVFKADKMTGYMRAAELETVAIDFVDKEAADNPYGDGLVSKDELTFHTDYREQAKELNAKRAAWFDKIVPEGYDVKKGKDGNFYLEGKDNEAFLSELETKYGVPADTFGSVVDAQKYLGVKADGKVGTGTVDAMVRKGADVLVDDWDHGRDPATRSAQDKLMVGMFVDLLVQSFGGGEEGKQKLADEARTIVANGGPRNKTEKMTVAAALELQPDQNGRLKVLGLDDETIHKAISEAAPGERKEVAKDLRERTVRILPFDQQGAVLECIKREEGLATRAELVKKAKHDPLSHAAYTLRAYDDATHTLSRLDDLKDPTAKAMARKLVVDILNEEKVTNPYVLGADGPEALKKAGIVYDDKSKSWTLAKKGA